MIASSFINSKQKSINSSTCILEMWSAQVNSWYSPLVIHTLKLYRVSLYFSPSLVRNINCFIIFPTLDVHIDEDRETYLSPQPLKLSTWFLHYWNQENLVHPFALHVIFTNLLFLVKNVNIWCNELFDVLLSVLPPTCLEACNKHWAVAWHFKAAPRMGKEIKTKWLISVFFNKISWFFLKLAQNSRPSQA